MKAMLFLTMILLILGSCAPMHEKAFLKEGEDSARIFSQKPDFVQQAILVALAENGFHIEGVITEPRMVRARKIIAEGKKSCEISLCCYLFSPNEKETKVQLAAEEQISEVSYKMKTFWLIFIPIPYGREPKREVIKKGVITDPEFFKSFFTDLERHLPKK